MEYRVIKRFRDKLTKKVYSTNAPFDTKVEGRAEELLELGYIEKKERSPLEQNVGDIKKALTKETPVEKLEVLLEQEKSGENRKGVLEHIEALLSNEED